MTHIILGAGISGLSAALKLTQANKDVTILEKKPYVGGIAASTKIQGNIFDFGPHAYHSEKHEVMDRFKVLSGNEYQELKKDVRIKFNGNYYKYPLEIKDFLLKLNPMLAFLCVTNFLYVNIKNSLFKTELNTTKDWLVSKFGRRLYDIYFGPYTEKVWGIKPSRLSPLFAKHRIPHKNLISATLKSILKNRYRNLDRSSRYAPHVSKFIYPNKGSGVIPDSLARQIISDQGNLSLSSEVRRIRLQGNRVLSVICRNQNGRENISGEYFISTIPINEMLSIMEPRPPEDLLSILPDIKYRSIVVICLLIKKQRLFDSEWIYFTDRIFNRLSDIRNCGAIDTIEPGKTGLMAEITCNPNDDVWNSSKETLCQKVIRDLEQEGFIKPSDVEFCSMLKVRHGYPIYTIDYEKRMAKVINYLKKIDNLLITGRQGLFKYVDMDIAMEMGEKTAEFILNHGNKTEVGNISFEERFFA